MTKIEKVLEYLSKKEWYLRSDWQQVKKYLDENAKEMEDIRSVKRYRFMFKQPLFFEHDLTTYKTGRIFAKYVFSSIPIFYMYHFRWSIVNTSFRMFMS